MAVSSSFTKLLVSLMCVLSIFVASCGFSSTSPLSIPPAPTAASNKINYSSEDVDRLRITLTGVEITPDGRLRFWIYAQNWSPNAKSLSLENFAATDKATGLVYRADVRESRWIDNVEARYGGVGQITLDRPLPTSVSQLRLSFSGMTDGNDVVIQSVPITTLNFPSLAQDLNLSSPFVDGLQLTVTRIEVSDGVVKMAVLARHMDIGLDPFGPQLYDDDVIRQEKAEVEAREWRHLQSKEFTFQDEQGRTYTVDGTRSRWDTEVIQNGMFSGFLTISDTLESSVSQLRLIYADVYRSTRFAITIEHIPVPQVGITTTPPVPNNPISECGFITSSPQLTDDEQNRRDLEWAASLQTSGIPYNPSEPWDTTPVATSTSIPTPVTYEVSLQSNKVCGLTLNIQRVTRDGYGWIILETTLTNEDLPYSLSLASLSINSTDLQGQAFESYSSSGMVEIRDKGEHSVQITLSQVPVAVSEIRISLTLPGKQALTIEHVPLP